MKDAWVRTGWEMLTADGRQWFYDAVCSKQRAVLGAE